jgi:hypothetical protein
MISTTPEEDKILDVFEGVLNTRSLLFSQRHRLRVWAVRGVQFWFKERSPEVVEFT